MKTSRSMLIIAVAFLLSGVTDAPTQSSTTPTDASAMITANPLHAARLRKLHLVRPDLINYPLSFDVVC